MALTASALGVELLTDPVSMGYASHVSRNDDNALAFLLNNVSANASKAVSQVAVVQASVAVLQAAVNVQEYLVLSTTQQSLWRDVLNGAAQGSTYTALMAQIAAVWDIGTITRGRILAGQRRACSRAEVLDGAGAVVQVNEVSKALGR